jgi:hypothetical protein
MLATVHSSCEEVNNFKGNSGFFYFTRSLMKFPSFVTQIKGIVSIRGAVIILRMKLRITLLWHCNIATARQSNNVVNEAISIFPIVE